MASAEVEVAQAPVAKDFAKEEPDTVKVDDGAADGGSEANGEGEEVKEDDQDLSEPQVSCMLQRPPQRAITADGKNWATGIELIILSIRSIVQYTLLWPSFH